jgi:23S rRNA (uracil1939-C5)-methyltransferase
MVLAMTDDQVLDITALGAQGDGVAFLDGERRYVPFALPGERVRSSEAGLPDILSAPSPERVPPSCRHFGVCGGCAAQHLSDALYAAWKRDNVVAAFAQRGLEPEVAPLVRVQPGSRRRAVFTAKVARDGTVLGFHRHRSHDLVDVRQCPVLVPAIVEKLPALRAVCSGLPQGEARVTVLATRAGLDVAIDGIGTAPSGAATTRLVSLALESGIARLTLAGAPLMERAAPTLPIGGTEMSVPPGIFVQAVEDAERELVRCVDDATQGARRVADLFCGIGTFAFPLAERARVLAIDSNATAVAALKAAVQRRQGLKPVETKVRDLFREPLSVLELQAFDAVVFDPPRAGATAQARQLAQSKVRTLVAVSCDAGTLARDVRTLVDGGYVIESVTPIDQFLYAPNVEIVAVLRKAR